jgi:hypothetical protein
MRATGRHALRAFVPHRGHRALLPVVLATPAAAGDKFAGQGAFYEDHLAIGLARNALGVQVERIDVQPFFLCHGGRLSGVPKRSGRLERRPLIWGKDARDTLQKVMRASARSSSKQCEHCTSHESGTHELKQPRRRRHLY